MEDWDFNQGDRNQMKILGISEEQIKSQIQMFQKSYFYIRLNHPCTIGDGIQQIPLNELEYYIKLQEKTAQEGRFLKFVPASGASSRMFDFLFKVYGESSILINEAIREQADKGDADGKGLRSFQEGIRKFPFFDDLKILMDSDSLEVERLIKENQWWDISKYLLTKKGLNYGDFPKGLLKFHQYPSGSRTAFEEHLVEAFNTVRDQAGNCRLHFTVSPEHEEAFGQFFKKIRPRYEQQFQSHFEVAFSIQKHFTNTIAVDLANRPFRDKEGRLIFRPGGHGALLENLNDLQGNLIYIKNIDNVLPDRLKEPTLLWKKVLGGVLVETEEAIKNYVSQLAEGMENPERLEEMMDFAKNKLSILKPQFFEQWPLKKKREFLLDRLNRPIRICGMVKNVGEPGGGPFWIEDNDGTLSLQIVEGTQVDPQSPEQQAIWASSTHFNPVDLVCGGRDYKDRPFHLKDYANSETVIISKKSKDGQDLKSLELPGLWNGGMAGWITLFVEVPNSTFNPVKTIIDLLKPGHQPG